MPPPRVRTKVPTRACLVGNGTTEPFPVIPDEVIFAFVLGACVSKSVLQSSTWGFKFFW